MILLYDLVAFVSVLLVSYFICDALWGRGRLTGGTYRYRGPRSRNFSTRGSWRPPEED